MLLCTIEVLAGTKQISSIIEEENVIIEMRTKTEETVEHPTYNKAQSGDSTPVDKMNALFILRIKKRSTKEWRSGG